MSDERRAPASRKRNEKRTAFLGNERDLFDLHRSLPPHVGTFDVTDAMIGALDSAERWRSRQ